MKRVLVVGGSEAYVGAVYLAAISALRSGAGSVIVAAPEKVAWALNTLSPDLMTRKFTGPILSTMHTASAKKLLETADILLIGNGAGVRASTASFMRAMMRWPGLKVIDADALKVLRGTMVKNSILTPNEGEWNILKRYSNIKELLQHNVIVRKGRRSSILFRNNIYVQKRTNPGLQKAGMGDVLAGMCAGFLAQGFSLLDAARMAADTGNQIANILTKKKRGYYFLASDLLNEIRKTSNRMRK